MDVTGILKSLIATAVAGAVFVFGVFLALNVSEMSPWFWVGVGFPFVVCLALLIPYGIWLGASDSKTTTFQGIMCFLGVIALLAVVVWGILDDWLLGTWNWGDIILGILSLICFIVSVAVVHSRVTLFK
ncbi:MAG TPA: hypothetical protein VFZ58_00730 [Candidatus Saccharimonadales bacterium]